MIWNSFSDLHPENSILSREIPVIIKNALATYAREIQQPHNEVIHELLRQLYELPFIWYVKSFCFDVVLFGGFYVRHIKNHLTEMKPVYLCVISQVYCDSVCFFR